MPDVLKTLLLNPPSFENFDGEQARAGPQRARLSPTGTLFGCRIRRD